MENVWEIIEENDEIKQEFRGEAYKNGLLKHKHKNWVFFPTTVKMLPRYKVWKWTPMIILNLSFNLGDESKKIRYLGGDISKKWNNLDSRDGVADNQ